MKSNLLIVAVTFLLAAGGSAMARKPCDELKHDIATKLDGKSVVNYQLDIVDAASVDSRKTVGSCDGGRMRIVYQRGVWPAPLAKR